MANRRIVLQPIFTALTSTTGQEVRFAVPTGGAKSGLAWINVTANASTATVTFKIVGASERNLATAGFWLQSGSTTIAASTTGAVQAVLTNLPDFLRWTISGQATGNVDFE